MAKSTKSKLVPADSLKREIQATLTEDLASERHRTGHGRYDGFAYPAAEAYFHLARGYAAGLTPMQLRRRGRSSDRRGVNEVYELLLDLDADESQIDFSIVYTNARAGWASLTEGEEGTDVAPLMDLICEAIPAPTYEDGAPRRGTSPTWTPPII